MLDNWVVNSEMKKLLKDVSTYSNIEELEINLHQLKELLAPPLKKVNDCIIISRESEAELETYFERAVKLHWNRTGYEFNNTETRINAFFENEISMIVGTQVALMVIEIWALKLKQLEQESKFCLIMACNEERVEIRFHKVRETEGNWVDDNIENYADGAIGYVIV